MKSNLLTKGFSKKGKVFPFAKRCLSLAMAATLAFPVGGGIA